MAEDTEKSPKILLKQETVSNAEQQSLEAERPSRKSLEAERPSRKSLEARRLEQASPEDTDIFENHPRFEEFKDLSSFSKEHLPACYQHDEMVNLIMCLADITVKIEVSELPGTNRKCISGTGKVERVKIKSKRKGQCQCQCDTCKISPAKEWGKIAILTVAQVAFGSTDAKHLVCSFFYDNDDQMDNIQHVQGCEILGYNEETDLCMFTCVTCDMNLVKLINDKVEKCVCSWKEAFRKYVNTVKWEVEKLVVIVSHPYGRRKHISIGKRIDSKEDQKITYTNPSCPGSVGFCLDSKF